MWNPESKTVLHGFPHTTCEKQKCGDPESAVCQNRQWNSALFENPSDERRYFILFIGWNLERPLFQLACRILPPCITSLCPEIHLTRFFPTALRCLVSTRSLKSHLRFSLPKTTASYLLCFRSVIPWWSQALEGLPSPSREFLIEREVRMQIQSTRDNSNLQPGNREKNRVIGSSE